jgi:transcriptional regulator with XRE-family HTH domain
MPNERLRSSFAVANLSVLDVASHIGVDPKTVERWITKARVPHRAHRWATAKLLGTDEAYLWPETVDDLRTKSASEAEFLHLYPHRGAVPASLWETLLDRATDSIDVLIFSGLFLSDSHGDLADTLIAKARNGTKIRIVLGDPSSDAVARRAEEEDIGDGLAARIKLSHRYLRSTLEARGIELRTHATTLYNSLYRFDEDMLINAHVYGAPAAQNPVIHLRRVPGGRLFEHYLTSFERVWATATSIEAPVIAAGGRRHPS